MPFGLESLHVGIEDSDTVNIALLRMTTEQLLTYTDTEDWLPEVADDLIKAAGFKVFHGTASLSLSREDDTIGIPERRSIIGEHRVDAQSPQCIHHREDVACIIFHYCYLHVN